MLGIAVRLHDLTGEDLGTAHAPWPVEIGDLVLTEHGEYVVHDVVQTGQTFPIAALVKVRPAHLRPLVAS